MVKVGFICEGDTERKIVESAAFQKTLLDLGLLVSNPLKMPMEMETYFRIISSQYEESYSKQALQLFLS